MMTINQRACMTQTNWQTANLYQICSVGRIYLLGADICIIIVRSEFAVPVPHRSLMNRQQTTTTTTHQSDTDVEISRILFKVCALCQFVRDPERSLITS